MVEFQVIFCVAVLLLGFFGNLLVIITFCSKGSRVKAYEILMISLAISDLLGTFCLPLITILTLKSVDISFLGQFGCKFVYWLSTTSITVSAFSLVAIAIDRFRIVIRPLGGNRTKPWKICLVALFIWVLASPLGIIYYFRIDLYEGQNMCLAKYENNKEEIIHTVILFVIQMILPVLTMSVMYGIILYRLRLPTVRKLSAHKSIFEIRQRRNRQSTKLFLTVVIVFYILTLPYNIFYIWYTFNWKTITNKEAITHTYHILLLILLCNSCANPLMYSRLHKSFRRDTVRLLCSCLLKKYPKFWYRSSSGNLSFRWRSRSSSRRNTFTTTATSSGSPVLHAIRERSPPAYKHRFTELAAENNLNGHTANYFDNRRRNSTDSTEDEFLLETPSARVDYLKPDDVVAFFVHKNAGNTTEKRDSVHSSQRQYIGSDIESNIDGDAANFLDPHRCSSTESMECEEYLSETPSIHADYLNYDGTKLITHKNAGVITESRDHSHSGSCPELIGSDTGTFNGDSVKYLNLFQGNSSEDEGKFPQTPSIHHDYFKVDDKAELFTNTNGGINAKHNHEQ